MNLVSFITLPFLSFAIGRLAPFVRKQFFSISLLLFFFSFSLCLCRLFLFDFLSLLASIILLLIAVSGHHCSLFCYYYSLNSPHSFVFLFENRNIISRRNTTHRRIHEIQGKRLYCCCFKSLHIYPLAFNYYMWNILLNVCA